MRRATTSASAGGIGRARSSPARHPAVGLALAGRDPARAGSGSGRSGGARADPDRSTGRPRAAGPRGSGPPAPRRARGRGTPRATRPGSRFPPGNSHSPPRCFAGSRRVTRKRPARSMTAGGHLHHGEAGARGQLSEEREERGAVGRPHAGVSARVRRVEEDHDLSPAGPEAPPVVVRETHGLVEHGARGDGAHGDHDLRAERLELGGEERLAPARLARERAAVSRAAAPRGPARRGPALDGVGQVEEVLEVEPETPDLAAQDHPAGAGPLPPVLDAGDSRRLADQDEPGVAPAEGARRELPPAAHRRARAARGDPAERSRERARRRPGGPLRRARRRVSWRPRDTRGRSVASGRGGRAASSRCTRSPRSPSGPG